MLISETQEREIHKLLPQTHRPGVDYSLFIIDTVEKSLEEVETCRGGVTADAIGWLKLGLARTLGEPGRACALTKHA